MHVSALSAITCLVIVAGWIAVGTYCRRTARREASRDAEWAAMAANLRALDGELDRVWAAEAQRTRPD